VEFTSDERQNKETDTRISNENAFQREVCRSVVTKRKLSTTPKLSVFKSVPVSILTYGLESWVMAEIVISISGRNGIFALSSRSDTSR